MKIFCDYHPTVAALWNCPECESYYCSNCITQRVVDVYGKKKAHYFCPKCNVNVERLSIGNIIQPYWTRLPKIFLYPFRPVPLIFMIILSFVSLLYGLPLLGFMLYLGVYCLILKYAFACLRRTAQGRFTPPKINGDMITGDVSLVFKQIALYVIIWFMGYWVTKQLGIVVGLLFLYSTLLLIPSMVIMLVATESLLSALNPVLFISMAWRIGWNYLLMCFFLMLLLSAPTYLWQFIFSYLPEGFQSFLITFASAYYTFVAYHLMGYVLLQYHEEIGYEVDVEEEELAADGTIEKHTGRSEILNRVDMFIQDGKVDEAIALIQEETAGHMNDLHLAERYYKLLNIKQVIPEMLSHAKLYLDLLVKQKAGQQVCKIYQDCLSKDPEFMPCSATLLKVAGYLNDSAKPEAAVQAYNRFIKADPKNNLVPKAYFLAASVINEKLKNKPKAVSILNAVIKKYPNHEIIPYVQRYLKQIV